MATPWQASFSPKGRERSLVEAVGIGSRREAAAHGRRRGADGWRRRPDIGWLRRDAAASGREQPTGRFPEADTKDENRRPKAANSRALVEAVGVEPTSEELRSPVSPCAAGYFISPRGQLAGNLPRGQPDKISITAFGRDGNPARLTSSIPDQRAEPREGRGYLRSQSVVVIGSCSCLHPFYERMALDTLPTTETVPRQNRCAPGFDSYGESTTRW